MKTLVHIGVIMLLALSVAFGDVRYQETTTFKGGTLMDMIQKTAMKEIVQDQQYQLYIKGNKMARRGSATASIFDLDARTITTINNAKRTYTVMTFDEMEKRTSQGQSGNLAFDVRVDKTGQTKLVDGEKATEFVLTIKAKQPSLPSQTVVTMHAWIVAPKPAMKEVQDFQRRLSEKFADALPGTGFGAAAKGISAGMNELAKQDGYPVETEISVSGVAGLPTTAATDPNAPLIVIETESGHFVQGNLDDSNFAIPARVTKENPNLGSTLNGMAPDSGSSVFRAGGEVSSPLLKSKVEPYYSEEAHAKKISGSVLLSVIIDENGIPTNIKVTRPLGYGLDDKAIEAVQKWRFQPGMKDGKPVRVRASIEVTFRLVDAPK